jgi:nucleotide-binding universal stress UspA family protein
VPVQRFKNILVVLSQEEIGDTLRERILRFVQTNHAAITLIDVVGTSPSDLAGFLSALPRGRAAEIETGLEAVHTERLEALAEPLRSAGASVETVVRHGTGFIEVIRQVLGGGHDLVLKEADRDRPRSRFRGPDLHLMRKCPCPVWIHNGPPDGALTGTIMASVAPDPDDPVRDALNHKVMELATSLARQEESRIKVIHVWHIPDEATLRSRRLNLSAEEIAQVQDVAERQSERRLEALLSDFAPFSDIMDVTHVKGVAADIIAAQAEAQRVDTLVMGTVGRTGMAGFFIGNTAETVLNRVQCSVLAVKPEGFVSPVSPDAGAA